MKLFIGKLLLFVLLLFAVDFLLGNIVSDLHLKTKNNNLQNANYGFVNYDNDDILFFGASEVAHSFISNKITEETGLLTYNLASDGSNIYYQYPLLETVLEKHSPKVIVISAYQLTQDNSGYNNRMYPYYHKNEYVKNVIDEIHPNEKFKMMAQGYIYNSQIIRIFDGRGNNERGYVPLSTRTDILDNQSLDELPEGLVYEITDTTKSYFIKFVKKAVSKGVKVYVYVPPVLEKINLPYLDSIKAITQKTGARLMDFSKDYSILDRRELFNDKIHLNHNGAKVLTNELLEILKKDTIY